MRPYFNLAGKGLDELTVDQVRALLDEPAAYPGNRLFSEVLTSAHNDVLGTSDQSLNEAFKKTALLLMTGENAPGSGSGFGLRTSLGHAVTDMLREGNSFKLDEMIRSAQHEPTLEARLEALKGRLEMYAMKNKLEVHSTDPHATRTPAAHAPVARA